RHTRFKCDWSSDVCSSDLPSALLNGMTVGGTGASSGGAVGGSVNLITKHAPDVDITQLTGTYASKSQFGEQIDVSRRYGEHKERSEERRVGKEGSCGRAEE